MTIGARETRTRQVLDAIEGALNDPGVSDDAMRWSPDPEQADREERALRRDEVLARAPRPGRRGMRMPVPPPGYREEVEAQLAYEQAARNIRRAIEVDPEALARFRASVADLGRYAERLFDALRPSFEAAGKAAGELAAEWQRAAAAVNAANAGRSASGEPRPPVTLRDTDPRAYALQAARTRGSSPVRQAQHERRPRRIP